MFNYNIYNLFPYIIITKGNWFTLQENIAFFCFALIKFILYVGTYVYLETEVFMTTIFINELNELLEVNLFRAFIILGT